MRHNGDRRVELVEDDIWEVVRDAIQTGAIVRVMELAIRIAAAHHDVMPLTEIAELLAEATVAAGAPIEIEGLPLAAMSSRVRAQNSRSFGRPRICAPSGLVRAP